MALTARAIHSELKSPKPAVSRREPAGPVQVQIPVQKPKPVVNTDGGKMNNIVLQPRLCTLRSYGSDRGGVIKTRRDGGDGPESGADVSQFFAILSEYIESSKKSQDFEIISGRLAMIVFAATVTTEMVTGNSLFRKMDLQGIAEAGGVCLGAITCAAIFAWFSSARSKVGRIFTLSCNTFIDSVIDQIVDGLFYDENEPSDWSDEI
ncbi:stress enhanced protein 2, chloroplastic [Quercus suber]|uniref:Stress enhanced protein 2 n=1 Tax=Quercus suber TaxID=58331 RepID=A0AAW0L113_QUESU|nr:stress enhanced protein 2, chloroplastic [Quercus suber]POE57406.1 stress enhanced protein 2, chloroplastic [Quercus suber]